MEFFCTGLLGPIGRGCTRGDVEHAFGPPEDYSFNSKRSHADIWRYATIEQLATQTQFQLTMFIVHEL